MGRRVCQELRRRPLRTSQERRLFAVLAWEGRATRPGTCVWLLRAAEGPRRPVQGGRAVGFHRASSEELAGSSRTPVLSGRSNLSSTPSREPAASPANAVLLLQCVPEDFHSPQNGPAGTAREPPLPLRLLSLVEATPGEGRAPPQVPGVNQPSTEAYSSASSPACGTGTDVSAGSTSWLSREMSGH